MWFCLKIAYLDLLVNHSKELLFWGITKIQTPACVQAPAPCAGLRQELQDFALTQPGEPGPMGQMGQMGQMGTVPTPMRKLERAENLYGRTRQWFKNNGLMGTWWYMQFFFPI